MHSSTSFLNIYSASIKQFACSMILLSITILLLIGSRPLNTTDFVSCTDIVWYWKRLWIYLRVLSESLPCLTKLLSMTMVGVASVV
jgi:hypothetical protein